MAVPTDRAEAPLRLADRVDTLAGVSHRRARLFARLGIHTVSDLLRHLPARYQREAAEDAIANLAADTVGSARGVIAAMRWMPRSRPGSRPRLEATIQDDTDTLRLVWFNGAYLLKRLAAGMHVRVQGKVQRFGEGRYFEMTNPRIEVLDDPDAAPAHEERLRPIYPATEDLSSGQIERIIADALPRLLPLVRDPLPPAVREHHAMPELADAYRMAHQPEDDEQAAAARRRLAFNELFLLQLGIAVKRAYVHERLTAPPLKHNDAIARHIRARLPFELTPGQQRVVEEIARDLTATHPMNRLLQGDVGSGKTVVALYALLMAVADRKQGALVAPTELLAEQHFASIGAMLEGSQVRLALLTGGQPPAASAERTALLRRLEAGEVDLLVGTHALFTESVRFRDLAVVVIDEQHRFGVQQRAVFRGRSAPSDGDAPDRRRTPHHLVMTATPIPRTLSLTIFGDLDISTIDGLPPGRGPIVNRIVEPDRADLVYDHMRQRLERGEQAYVVVPTIDADAGRAETAAQLKNVGDHARMLQQRLGDAFHVAHVHGRMKRTTREQVMDRFRRGKVHVLVATTVIEVGVDVPNATMMVIEHAERFGLAQLHQLRGRIGRASDARTSVCAFISDPTTDQARHRLDAIASTNDGFRIAELDLEIRGMGEFFGTRQAGLPPLRVAEIPRDLELLQLARRDAMKIVEQDPMLENRDHATLRRLLLVQYGEALGLIDVG
ncbi:MAG: ATP-dependent DNA helicase RecG [Phycisphaeraceae bacterium]